MPHISRALVIITLPLGIGECFHSPCCSVTRASPNPVIRHNLVHSRHSPNYQRTSNMLISQRRRIWSLISSTTATSNISDQPEKEEEEVDDWQVGNVQRDLELLRAAYAKSRAEDERNEIERMALLDEFARRRRPVSSALSKYVAGPLLLAIILKSIVTKSSSAAAAATKTTIVSLLVVNTAYFWTRIVISPILLLTKKIRSDSKLCKKFPTAFPTQRGPESRWDPDFEDPRTSCKDHILCLLENWVSSVCGSALLGIFLGTSFLQTILRGARRSNHSPFVAASIGGFSPQTISALLAGAQLFTRLGAVASLNQYVLLLHQMQRAEHVKPEARFQNEVRPRVHSIFNTLPIGIALDVATLMLAIPGQWIDPLSVVLLRRSRSLILFMLGLAMFAPLVHISCLKRILIVQFFTGMSLSSKCKTLSAKNDSSGSDDFKWRCWLRWREPQRILRVIRTAIRDDFVLRGYGRGIRYDSNLFRSVREEEEVTPSGVFAKKSSKQTESKLPIFQKIDLDKERGHYSDPAAQDRYARITRANERMKKLHQEDYDKGEFKDPLGVAVHRTLDIGLSFDFDHESKLKKGEEPSIHRLRTRAAKSAVRRYNELPKIAEKQLKTINDPDKKKAVGAKLAQETGDEVEDIVESIFSLIPTNAPPLEGKVYEKLRALSESEALALGDVPMPPDPESMVASVGEVSPYEYPENFVADPFLDKKYRDEFIRASKEKIAAEREGKNESQQSEMEDPTLLDDDDDDEFVSDWLKQTGTSEDTYLA